jgi:Zn ribbon nucleic-acid-binding protein
VDRQPYAVCYLVLAQLGCPESRTADALACMIDDFIDLRACDYSGFEWQRIQDIRL